MHIKNLLLLVYLFSSLTVWANNGPSSIIETIPAANDEVSCNQPAPFFFQIDEVGTTWVKYGWGGNASFKHRVRTYRASDNALLNTTIVPAGNASVTINGLPSGTELYGVINAVCTDDSHSPYEKITETRSTLILDLLVESLSPPNPSTSDWSTTSTGTHAFYGNQTENSYFKIYKTSNSSNFRVFGIRLVGAFHYKVPIHDSNIDDDSNFDFQCNGNDPEPSCSGPQYIEIWGLAENPPAIVGTITTIQDAQTSIFKYTQVVGGYTVENIIPVPEPPPGRSSYTGQTKGANIAAASPNPFSESLDVFLSPSIENIHLKLFNLSGRKVLDQQFRGGQEQYSISTPSISPGFYLLRIEADGEVQTLKVVKSE